MLPIELFEELIVNDIEFNGDVELTEDGIKWTAVFMPVDLLPDEEALVVEDELIEELEEDLEYIVDLFWEYEDMDMDVAASDFELVEGVMTVNIILVEYDDEDDLD